MNRPRCVLDDILDRGDFSPVTRTQYERVIGMWVTFAGATPAGWTRLTAQRFYDSLLAEGTKAKTANLYIASLRYVSKWYATQYGGEDFAVVQTRSSEALGELSAPRRALKPDEVRDLLETCEDSLIPIAKRPVDRRDRALLITGLETGMRRISLAGMRLENIHKRPYPFATVPIKGRGGRATFDVPLSDTALLAISDWAGWLAGRGVKQGPVFPTLHAGLDKKGGRYFEPGLTSLSLMRIYDLVTARGKAAGLKHVHPHLMRHTFVTWRKAEGLDVLAIASITGHKLNTEAKGLSPYFDLKALGETARQSTPPWFAEYVRGLIR